MSLPLDKLYYKNSISYFLNLTASTLQLFSTTIPTWNLLFLFPVSHNLYLVCLVSLDLSPTYLVFKTIFFTHTPTLKYGTTCPFLTAPASNVGLGFWSLVHLNQALLGKWLWQHLTEKNAYWRIVIASKYGSMWGNWMTVESLVSMSHGVNL